MFRGEVKKYLSNYVFYVAIVAVALLLLSGTIFINPETGKQYNTFSMFDKSNVDMALYVGRVNFYDVFLSESLSYLWMFAPVLAGLPLSVLICGERKNSLTRFEVFRVGKKKYIIHKLFAGMVSGGLIFVMGHIIYLLVLYLLMYETKDVDMYGFGVNDYMVNNSQICKFAFSKIGMAGLIFLKFVSVFLYGMFSTVITFAISSFMKNKYMVLCVPMIINYFWIMIAGKQTNAVRLLKPQMLENVFSVEDKYILILFAGLVVVSAIIYMACLERRCDCGEN